MDQSNSDLQKLIQASLQRRGGKNTPVQASLFKERTIPRGVEKIKSITLPNKKTVPSLREDAYKARDLIEKVKIYAGNIGNLYLTFGGVGDLVLLLGECYNDKSAKIIFFANQPSVKFANDFISYFKLKSFIHPNIMGTITANQVHWALESTGRLKKSAHLAKGLDYGDWRRNPSFYEAKITSRTNWKNEIGKLDYLNGSKLMLLAPSGSIKNEGKKRYLSNEEYFTIADIYLSKGWTVYSVGSEMDAKTYPSINNKNHAWLTSDKTIYSNGSSVKHTFEVFLKTINSAKEVISMDTWLKTYTLLAGIPTKVIESKFNGSYQPYGHDSSDYVFLNKNLWPELQIIRPENIITDSSLL